MAKLEQFNCRDVGNYIFKSQRLETFKTWVFDDNSSCNADKMAEAGFIKKVEDEVECFVCLKELDGWEENDDPWTEHKKHSSSCLFMKLGKKEEDLTFYEMTDLLFERTKNITIAQHAEMRSKILEAGKKVRNKLVKLSQSQK
ncbi:baculoviral IAP repeat-containing protein 5 isoform X2 [Periplaneta americana]